MMGVVGTVPFLDGFVREKQTKEWFFNIMEDMMKLPNLPLHGSTVESQPMPKPVFEGTAL
jgi:hypothetical protein